MIALVAGCGSSANPSSSGSASTSGPGSSPSGGSPTAATRTTGPAAEPSAYGGDPSAVVLGVPRLTAGTITACTTGARGTICTADSDDPRVSGTRTSTPHVRRLESGDPANEAWIEWGTARLVNDGGAWDGRYSGIFTPGLGERITFWYTGRGGYAGLSYFEMLTRPTSGDIWTTAGLIFPGSVPPR
jgi:hypothetical protein